MTPEKSVSIQEPDIWRRKRDADVTGVSQD